MKNVVIFMVFLLKAKEILMKPVNQSLVHDDELIQLIWKALEGFRNVILDGDDSMEIDSFEPCIIDENLLWYYEDRTGKDKIYVDTVGSTFLYGLSTFMIKKVSASKKNLDAEIELTFPLLQIKGKYKAGGHLFKNIIPIFGNGYFNAKTENVNVKIFLNMSLIDSFVFVDETSISVKLGHFSVKVSNIFRIPSVYTKPILNKILKNMYDRYGKAVNSELNEILLDLSEDAFSGMTIQEIIDMLNYLAEKENFEL